MSGYYLTSGKREPEGVLERLYYNLYLPKAEKATIWFENNFGEIAGEGWGVRNWFKPSREGEWTYKNIKIEQIQFFFAIFLVVALVVMLVKSLLSTPKDWILFSVAIVYLFLTIFMGMIIIGNYIDKRAPFEYISYGRFSKIKVSIILTLIWIYLYIIFGQIMGLNIQQTIVSIQQQIIVTSVFLAVVQLLIIPWVETAFFVVTTLPTTTRFIGIIPAIIFVALFSGGLHLFILQGNLFGVMMSILFGLLFYPIALKYVQAFPVLFAHILANTIALILNTLIK